MVVEVTGMPEGISHGGIVQHILPELCEMLAPIVVPKLKRSGAVPEPEFLVEGYILAPAGMEMPNIKADQAYEIRNDSCGEPLS